jgi:hypothetical protein
MSSIAAVYRSDETSSAISSSAKRADDAVEDTKEEDKVVVREIYKSEDSVKRNKRMFGSLMGHLGRAKKKLDEDSEVIETQKRAKTIAVQKNLEESSRIAEITKRTKKLEHYKVTLNNSCPLTPLKYCTHICYRS